MMSSSHTHTVPAKSALKKTGDAAQVAKLQSELSEKEDEIKRLKKGITNNLSMLTDLENLYEQEIEVLRKKVKAEAKEKNHLAHKLNSTERQLKTANEKMELLENSAFDQHQPFWEFVKEMQTVNELLTQKIQKGKKLSEEEETSNALATVRPPSPTPMQFLNPATAARRRTSHISGMAKLKRGVQKIKIINALSKKKFTNWSSTLRRADPRFQILHFFDTIAKKGADALGDACEINTTGYCTNRCLQDDPNDDLSMPSQHRQSEIFNKAGIFTVWRPTSLESIRRMMVGEGVGKGLDIKGKSAKKGHLSAFVPFLQLHLEKHKHMVRTIPVTATLRVFYKSKPARDQAHQQLTTVAQEMTTGYAQAQRTLARLNEEEAAGFHDPQREETREEAFAKWMWELDGTPSVVLVDEYAPRVYGLTVSQRVFFETYVMRGDCHREPGGMHDTGRGSEPAFQDMNMETLRGASDVNAPRPVLLQYTTDDQLIMDPRYLLMAYEEKGKVRPVVSDFDCFLVGTRRINFDKPLPDEQLELMKWCIRQIETILAIPPSHETWTMRWLENLKNEYQNGFHVELPKYGFADPKSYSIMAHAVDRLVQHGSVRHGAECFNYYFPQELDDEFLVVTNNQPNGPWVKYDKDGLLKFLSGKIDQGFMFPLNPKWVLCDPGWKLLWDKQMATENETAQNALDSWYPPESGVREMIEGIAAKYPAAFRVDDGAYQMEDRIYSPLRQAREEGEDISGDTAMDMALLEVEHDRALRKAVKAVRAVIFANRLKNMNLGIKKEIDEEEQKEKDTGSGESNDTSVNDTPLDEKKDQDVQLVRGNRGNITIVGGTNATPVEKKNSILENMKSKLGLGGGSWFSGSSQGSEDEDESVESSSESKDNDKGNGRGGSWFGGAPQVQGESKKEAKSVESNSESKDNGKGNSSSGDRNDVAHDTSDETSDEAENVKIECSRSVSSDVSL